MHAWLCTEPTGVEALKWTELPTPAPGPGEVLIKIEAASLNFPDLLIVQNKYQMKPALPFVPGSEYAGVVEAVGPGVTHLSPGQAWLASPEREVSAPTPWHQRPCACRCPKASPQWMPQRSS